MVSITDQDCCLAKIGIVSGGPLIRMHHSVGSAIDDGRGRRLYRRISKGYPVEVSSKSVHPSQSCVVKFDPLFISLQHNVKPMVKTGFSCHLARSQSRMLRIAWSVCRLALEIYRVLE